MFAIYFIQNLSEYLLHVMYITTVAFCDNFSGDWCEGCGIHTGGAPSAINMKKIAYLLIGVKKFKPMNMLY